MSNTPVILRRSQLGELLVGEGKLSREELEAALAYRQERGLKLGQALVALHLVTQQDLANALRSQGRVHCLNLTPGLVETEVARLLPESMARQYVAVPVHRVAGRITVAMEDPAEEYDVDAIAVALGEPIFPVHAEPERILETIERVYPASSPPPEPERPRFSLVRGPLPDAEPEEAADALARGALREAIAVGASSLHVEATARGTELSFRVEGARTPVTILPAEWTEPLVQRLLALAGVGAQAGSARGTCDVGGQRVTLDVVTIASIHGRCARAAIGSVELPRPLADGAFEPEELALIRRWAASSGLVLLVGREDCALTATTASILEHCANEGRRVYAFGDEARNPASAVLIARTADADLPWDLERLASQSPDVVDAGELTSSDDLRAAARLARGDTLVVARRSARDGSAAAQALAVHAGDPLTAADVLRGTIAQRTVRLLCQACRTSGADGPELGGCESCQGTGWSGRAVLHEVLDFEGSLRAPLERGSNAAAIREAAASLGFPSLSERGALLVRQGLTTRRELERALAR